MMCTRTQDHQGTPARTASRTSLATVPATCVQYGRIGYIQDVLVFKTHTRAIQTTVKLEKSHHIAGQHKRNQNKLEELKLLIHHTHADIITLQKSKLTPNAKTHKVHNFTTMRTDRLHNAEGMLITLSRDNITFTTTDIPSTINTHNT